MKRTIILAITVLLAVCLLSGCGVEMVENNIENNGYNIQPYNFREERLVYDADTLIVYIENYTYHGNYVYTQYLSENGLPYKYIDGEFVEVRQ